jgi:glycerol-3-phosphate O-acyltransferase
MDAAAFPCHGRAVTTRVELPIWLLLLILMFAAVTFASHFLFPSVRWFLRRRAERLVSELNKRLDRPIQPFKLLDRTDMIQRLIYDPGVMKAVTEHAHENGVREDVAFERAKHYAREIVPSFSASIYFRYAIRAARWLSTRLYDVRVDGEARLAAVDRDATVVFVMNHRSNMDYVLVTYVAAKSSPIAYAVGEWARIWPLRSLIRAMGGYFIRRQYRTALYRKVLARYVQMATGAGVAQAIFPEGGLSLDGRIGAPKLGLFTYLIAEFDGTGRDIVFVPVALNYDRVLEDTILLRAGQEGTRRFRGSVPDAARFTLRYVWRRMRGRAHRMGSAGVAFGEPLSLSEWHSAARDVRTEALAGELMRRVQLAMPVLPVPLVAAILAGRGPMDREELDAAVAAEVARLRSRGARVMLPEDDGVREALKILRRRGLVGEAEGVVGIVPERAELTRYYASSVGPLLVSEPVETVEAEEVIAT